MSKIIVNFTAHDKRGGGSFQEAYHIATEAELAHAVEQFDEACPFKKYEMETEARHADDDSALTDEERIWFVTLDENEDIGFFD